ncbi:MAG: RdgB/HAM1 family non-canonical purine NTP pyrophosphatase [Candidatus Aenigmarchaeota archaeon]|nr:RdgB/HAM1 family non-canonical purine NTP pyrophosphatase [Candidatus Aenigmarchaeota archaeon]
MKKIYFVTSNKNKFIEAEKILDMKLVQAKLKINEIQALDNRKVVEHKAREAYSILKKPVIAEDTGLYIKDWKGFPGALVSWVVGTIGIEKLCKLLRTRRDVTAKACVSYYDGKNLKTFCGQVNGKISGSPRGSDRFDWDRIFIPDGEKRTFAQMSIEEKNKISHRMKAFRKLKRFLESEVK